MFKISQNYCSALPSDMCHPTINMLLKARFQNTHTTTKANDAHCSYHCHNRASPYRRFTSLRQARTLQGSDTHHDDRWPAPMRCQQPTSRQACRPQKTCLTQRSLNFVWLNDCHRCYRQFRRVISHPGTAPATSQQPHEQRASRHHRHTLSV